MTVNTFKKDERNYQEYVLFLSWKPNIQLESHLTQSNVSFPSFFLIYKMWKAVVLPHRVSERIVDMHLKPKA